MDIYKSNVFSVQSTSNMYGKFQVIQSFFSDNVIVTRNRSETDGQTNGTKYHSLI